MAATLASVSTTPPAKETMNGYRGIGAAKPHAYVILIIVIFQCSAAQTKVKKKNYGEKRQSFKNHSATRSHNHLRASLNEIVQFELSIRVSLNCIRCYVHNTKISEPIYTAVATKYLLGLQVS